MTGIIQASWSIGCGMSLVYGVRSTAPAVRRLARPPRYHFMRAGLVRVQDALVPVQAQNDRQADGDLAGRQGDDHQREDLPVEDRVQRSARGQVVAEGHQVDVGRVEHQLDAEQHRDGVAAGHDAEQPHGKEQSGDDQIGLQRYGAHGLVRLPSVAPAPWRRSSRPAARRRRPQRAAGTWSAAGAR